MNRYAIAVVWFSRVLLAGATLLLLAIAIRTLRDPVAATLPQGIALQSPTGTTIARVGFGGFPLGLALALFACLVSRERLRAGLMLLLLVVSAVTLVRIQGLVIDGASERNLQLLRPEFALIALSTIGLVAGRTVRG